MPDFPFRKSVSAVYKLLKLKDKYHERNQRFDDAEGRVALISPAVHPTNAAGTGRIALLDSDSDVGLPQAQQTRSRNKRACCVCCGLDCSLYWKAIVIVLGFLTLYYGFKAVLWVFTPSPTGLEEMPAFSKSLGCLDAPYLYNSSQVTLTAQPSFTRNHGFDIRGGAVGTITIADGDPDATEVKYKLDLRTDDENLLKAVFLGYPEGDDDGKVTKSLLQITTPQPAAGSCMRFDLTMYIPRNMRHVHVQAHATAHVQFTPGARVDAEGFYVTLYDTSTQNIILSSKDIQAKELALEVFQGWIVGEASIVGETSITTQRGAAKSNVRVYPVAPVDSTKLEPASFRTTTGAGRSDFFYIDDDQTKRPISATHTSSKRADLYLHYRQANFDGKIMMESDSYTLTGATPMRRDTKTVLDNRASDDEPQWTHYVGNIDGSDEIYVSSGGWTGLYL